MRGGFLAFFGLKSLIPLFCLKRSRFSPSINWFLSPNLSFSFEFHLFSYVFVVDLLRRMVVRRFFLWVIKTITLFRSNKEVTSNPYSSVCFIRPGILCVIGILGLFFM